MSKIVFIIIIIIVGILGLSQPVLALPSFLPERPTGTCPKDSAGNVIPLSPDRSECNYSFCDLLQVFVNIAQWILGIAGSLALLFFVIGGLAYLLAGLGTGGEKGITRAKQILSGSLFGLLIILFSWLMVNTTILLVQGGSLTDNKTPAQVFYKIVNQVTSQPWSTIECELPS